VLFNRRRLVNRVGDDLAEGAEADVPTGHEQIDLSGDDLSAVPTLSRLGFQVASHLIHHWK
jgi:hypothetical protein